MNYKSFVGTLTHVPYGPDGSKHYFELEDETFLNVKFAGGYTQADVMTDVLNRKISLTLSTVEIDGFHVVPDINDFYRLLRNDKSLLMSNAALVKKHIGLFRQVTFKEDSPPPTDEFMAKAQQRIDNHARIVEDYYRRYGGHVWDVKVRGFVMMGNENAHPPTYARNDISKFIAEHPEQMGDFVPNYFHVHGGVSGGYCGQGNLPGNRSVTYMHYACGTKTMIHELGHNFGLHHASTHSTGNPDAEPPIPDKIVEYGDSTSIMSSTQSITGLNSVEVVRLGMEMDRETLVVNETKQVFVAPLEMSARDMRENEWQNIRVGDGAEPYHVSLRKTPENGWFYSNSRSSESTIFVHHYKRDKHSIRMLGDIRVGGTKTLPNGVKIKHMGYENECARVNIIFNDEPAPADLPAPFGFPTTMDSVSVTPTHSGAWYDPEFTGEGFDFHIKEDRTVMYWYTYNHGQISRRFYYAVSNTPVNGEGPIEFDLLTTEDGTWADPTLHEVVPAGKAQLYFDDGNNGVFSYDTPEHGRGSVEIVPVALSTDDPHNGSYYQPSRSGEGFTVQFYEHLGDVCVAFWYSYGPPERRAYGGYTGNMKQRWYTCVGKKNEQGSYDLTVSEALNNKWMGFRDEPGVEPVGTATLTIVDDTSIKFDYDLKSTTVQDTGTFDLVRLF